MSYWIFLNILKKVVDAADVVGADANEVRPIPEEKSSRNLPSLTTMNPAENSNFIF
ncbi:MAG: hypothetical protein ACP5RE_01365 [Candidatus Acidifodinimicrobium sp.]